MALLDAVVNVFSFVADGRYSVLCPIFYDVAFNGADYTGIMVSKIDQCMLDLMKFHGEEEQDGPQEPGSPVEQEPVATASAIVTSSSQSPKASNMDRVSAGNRLSSHRPQSPLSDSDVSEASQPSQSPVLSDTPPRKPSPKSTLSSTQPNDHKYL